MSKLRDSLNESLRDLPNDSNAAVKAIVNRGARPEGQGDSEPPEKPTAIIPNNAAKNLMKPLKFKDTHSNASLLLRNDVLQAIDGLAVNAGKGFKTKLVNEALIRILKDYGIDLPYYGG